MRMKWLLFFFISSLFATDGSLYLVNDSPYTLTAQIQGADGTLLGQEILQPGEQKNMVSNLNATRLNIPNRYDVALTPYVVIWQCPENDYYSICNEVSPGSYVKASICQGSHTCRSKERKEKRENLKK